VIDRSIATDPFELCIDIEGIYIRIDRVNYRYLFPASAGDLDIASDFENLSGFGW
jgi:hypothetical protein